MASKLLYQLKSILTMFVRKLKSKFQNEYFIGKYKISIPPNFALPDYQHNFRLYDKFLPVLANCFTSKGLIIDVGANIGDTAIMLVQNCNNLIVCIEPSDIFFPYLEKNINILDSEDRSRISIVKKLVGTGALTGKLSHTLGGTAGINKNEKISINNQIPLDKIIHDVSNILLLKVDTDGFDFDVIKSAQSILSDSEPILFWENYTSDDFQYGEFEKLYSLLTTKGYKYIYIFDNYGNIIAEQSDFIILSSINKYICSMYKSCSTRTIGYTDVLASTDRYYSVLDEAINKYKIEYIYKAPAMNNHVL